jgi:hypothetical protein
MLALRGSAWIPSRSPYAYPHNGISLASVLRRRLAGKEPALEAPHQGGRVQGRALVSSRSPTGYGPRDFTDQQDGWFARVSFWWATTQRFTN